MGLRSSGVAPQFEWWLPRQVTLNVPMPISLAVSMEQRMEIIRLEPGEEAPETENRVRIFVLNPQRYRWGGTVALTKKQVVFNECPEIYTSREAAEEDAIAWARTHGGEQILYIETDDA